MVNGKELPWESLKWNRMWDIFVKCGINLARLSFYRKRPQNAIPFDIPFLGIETEIFCSKESALFVTQLRRIFFKRTRCSLKNKWPLLAR